MSSIPSPEPILAAPGAGLPGPELFVARLLFGLRCRTGSRSAFSAVFQAERSQVRALVASCQADDLARRVLIRRPRGLEDSSRFWSVLMTLDHLRIVHVGMAGIIASLAREETPPGQASTAAVKPSADVTLAVIGDYEKSCDDLAAAVAAVPGLRTRARFAHPWFGPMDAFAWHALSGTHLRIHRVQIERILAGLKSDR